MAKSTVNPFAAAAKKSTSSPKAPSRPIYVADDLLGLNGQLVYRKDEVAEAIHNYGAGHVQFEQGKAMKDTNGPIIKTWTRAHYCNDWLLGGQRPANPAITNKDTGDGDHMKVIFMDSCMKMDDFQFNALVGLIGQKAAEDNVIRRNDFMINPELLDQKVKVQQGSKVVEQTVMDAIIAALQEKFAPSPEVLGSLFTAVEKFETKKGLIDKGLQLVTTGKTPADAQRLAQFLEIGRFTTQLKVGAKDNE
jgi:hypothetical protein